MKLKKLVLAASVAATLSVVALSASATDIVPKPSLGTSFNNLVVGTINITSLSDLIGSLYALDTASYSEASYSLQSVTFASATFGTLTGDLDPSVAGFSFKNVVTGSYQIKVSGTLYGVADIEGLALIGAHYTVTAVPEPESYAMLLAGLGLMGTIARRRSKARQS